MFNGYKAKPGKQTEIELSNVAKNAEDLPDRMAALQTELQNVLQLYTNLAIRARALTEEAKELNATRNALENHQSTSVLTR